MKKKNQIIKLCVIALVIILAAVIFISGLPISKLFGVYDIKPVSGLIKYGLDFTGGVYVVLQANETDTEITQDTLEKAVTIIRSRIDSLGVSEPEISQQGNDKIRISIPDIADEQAAIDMIGKTAELRFTDPSGNVILTGADVESSVYDNYTDNYGMSSPAVKLTFSENGAQLFSEATARLLNQKIYIMLDDEQLSDPTVNVQITDGVAYITNIGDKETAMELATLIRAGALPVDFTVVQSQKIGATLGEDALSKSLNGGLIGAALILLFMLLIYKTPGFAADMALLIYILLFMYIMVFLKVTLTLPGIAGIVLSIGMAVDANIIIFERIKEEVTLGKSAFSSINSGFASAFKTVLDANITTIIAAAALFFFGSGTIRGFALTLMIGVCVSMFTAVVVTKNIIKSVVTIFGGQTLSFGRKADV